MQKIKKFKISLRPASVRKNFKTLAGGPDSLTPEAEELIIRNHSMTPADTTLVIELAADFADVHAVDHDGPPRQTIHVAWDEAASGDGPIGMIVLSPLAKGAGYTNNIHYTHSSTLRTLEQIFGVTPLLGDAVRIPRLRPLRVLPVGHTEKDERRHPP